MNLLKDDSSLGFQKRNCNTGINIMKSLSTRYFKCCIPYLRRKLKKITLVLSILARLSHIITRLLIL